MTTVVRIARLRRPGGGTEPARARFSRASVSSRPAPKRSARWDLARASVVLNSTSLPSLKLGSSDMPLSQAPWTINGAVPREADFGPFGASTSLEDAVMLKGRGFKEDLSERRNDPSSSAAAVAAAAVAGAAAAALGGDSGRGNGGSGVGDEATGECIDSAPLVGLPPSPPSRDTEPSTLPTAEVAGETRGGVVCRYCE